MAKPQYIEYLNTFGAEIDISSQPRIEVDARLKEHITKEKKFKILERLFKKIIYHIRSKYDQCCDLVKHFHLNYGEVERQRLIDNIEELKNRNGGIII